MTNNSILEEGHAAPIAAGTSHGRQAATATAPSIWRRPSSSTLRVPPQAVPSPSCFSNDDEDDDDDATESYSLSPLEKEETEECSVLLDTEIHIPPQGGIRRHHQQPHKPQAAVTALDAKHSLLTRAETTTRDAMVEFVYDKQVHLETIQWNGGGAMNRVEKTDLRYSCPRVYHRPDDHYSSLSDKCVSLSSVQSKVASKSKLDGTVELADVPVMKRRQRSLVNMTCRFPQATLQERMTIKQTYYDDSLLYSEDETDDNTNRVMQSVVDHEMEPPSLVPTAKILSVPLVPAAKAQQSAYVDLSVAIPEQEHRHSVRRTSSSVARMESKFQQPDTASVFMSEPQTMKSVPSDEDKDGLDHELVYLAKSKQILSPELTSSLGSSSKRLEDVTSRYSSRYASQSDTSSESISPTSEDIVATKLSMSASSSNPLDSAAPEEWGMDSLTSLHSANMKLAST